MLTYMCGMLSECSWLPIPHVTQQLLRTLHLHTLPFRAGPTAHSPARGGKKSMFLSPARLELETRRSDWPLPMTSMATPRRLHKALALASDPCRLSTPSPRPPPFPPVPPIPPVLPYLFLYLSAASSITPSRSKRAAFQASQGPILQDTRHKLLAMPSSDPLRFVLPPKSSSPSPQTPMTPPHAVRRPTYPLAHSIRAKPRRIPLVMRFARGAIHSIIAIPVILHSLFTALVVYLDHYVDGRIGLPATIIPSLSIVVGLMLVFRNSTSYDRFWTGRNCLTTISTAVRNITRICLVNSRVKQNDGLHGSSITLDDTSLRDTEKIIKVLIAILYAIKHNLRAEFNIPPASLASMPQHQQTYSKSRASSRRPSYTDHDVSHHGESSGQNGQSEQSPLLPTEGDAENGNSGLPTAKSEYVSLLPDGLMGYEDQGLGLPLQLTVLVETYIRKGFDRGWFHAPLASQITVQVNSLVDAYGRMETIRTTPIPVAHLIHQKQVLALFACILPFAVVDDYGWWSVPIVAVVAFTLYGIEGIGLQLEDPFGYDKNDIKMDGIIEDTRRELMVLLDEWKATGEGRALGGMFE